MRVPDFGVMRVGMTTVGRKYVQPVTFIYSAVALLLTHLVRSMFISPAIRQGSFWQLILWKTLINAFLTTSISWLGCLYMPPII